MGARPVALLRCRHVQPHRRHGKRCGAPQNSEHRAALRPSNPASGTPPEEIQNAKSQRYLHPRAHCSSTEPGRGGNPGVPTGGRLRKMLSIPAAGRQPATRDRDGPPRRQLGRTWRPLLSARNQTRDKCCGGPPRRGPDGGLGSKTRAGARGVAGAGARPPDTRRLSSRAVHTAPTARDGVLST